MIDVDHPLTAKGFAIAVTLAVLAWYSMVRVPTLRPPTYAPPWVVVVIAVAIAAALAD